MNQETQERLEQVVSKLWKSTKAEIQKSHIETYTKEDLHHLINHLMSDVLINMSKKTYFIALTDSYGQRNGYYETIELTEAEIEMNRFGFKEHKGHFLYESLAEVLRAVQD